MDASHLSAQLHTFQIGFQSCELLLQQGKIFHRAALAVIHLGDEQSIVLGSIHGIRDVKQYVTLCCTSSAIAVPSVVHFHPWPLSEQASCGSYLLAYSVCFKTLARAAKVYGVTFWFRILDGLGVLGECHYRSYTSPQLEIRSERQECASHIRASTLIPGFSCKPCEPNHRDPSSITPLGVSRVSSLEYIGSPLSTLLWTSFPSLDWTS